MISTPTAVAFRATIQLGGKTATGIEVPDDIVAALELDTEPRVVTVPPDFAEALVADDAATGAFDALSYSHKRRFVLSIEGAKSHETRRRRIAKSVATLRAGRV